MFRLAKSKATTGTDATEKVLSVVYNEESIRQRKQRVRGSEAYSQQSTVLSYTQGRVCPTPCRKSAGRNGRRDRLGGLLALGDSLWTVTIGGVVVDVLRG